MTDLRRYRFFLGGQDLEMREIAVLLADHAPGRCVDLRLAWGAKASAYAVPIAAALADGETPVLIELIDDLAAEIDRHAIRVIDHHGKLAGANAPTSLHQVFALLGLPAAAWTRRMTLVAANDRAHVAGLIAAGAHADDIAAIRADDRAAQGVTIADEAEAVRAVAARSVQGKVTEVTTTSTTSSAIADIILPAMGGPGYEILVVVMPGKLAAFGPGAAILRLADAVSGSYWGGNLPHQGFWGVTCPNRDDVLAITRQTLAAGSADTSVVAGAGSQSA